MSEIASRGQLRLAYLRWAIFTVPLILLLGFLSARLVPSGEQNSWYMRLAKPEGMPPEWALPIVWGILYVLLGLALAMVVNARGSRMRMPAVALFVLQLVVSLAWSPVFFGLHQVTTALVILGVLLGLALVTTLLFARVRTGAALLMVPYLAGICYAAFLLYQIHTLNPDASRIAPGRSSDQIQII
ncbi:TspO/MBR family protein [Sphingomonas sp. dw_22]|uniref:TspO/MBR family protein n=1 Tax=Sphingomonas sp. dw_22 TaxID=2721175 RepID=UPI001BD4DD62|nr:TspO/MBR family protein [Sphingomonas sp. dw_22]